MEKSARTALEPLEPSLGLSSDETTESPFDAPSPWRGVCLSALQWTDGDAGAFDPREGSSFERKENTPTQTLVALQCQILVCNPILCTIIFVPSHHNCPFWKHDNPPRCKSKSNLSVFQVKKCDQVYSTALVLQTSITPEYLRYPSPTFSPSLFFLFFFLSFFLFSLM